MFPLKCAQCHKQFSPAISKKRMKSRKFCSLKCFFQVKREGSLVKNNKKKCNTCLLTKPVKEFFKDKSFVDGYYSQCRLCHSIYRKSLIYKLSFQETKELLEKPCFQCGITKEKDGKSLAIDHDRATGKVRGVLCRKHNIGIGYFNHSIQELQKAIDYLKQFS